MQQTSDQISYLPHSVFDWRFRAVSHDSTCPAGIHTTTNHRPSFPCCLSNPACLRMNLFDSLSWQFSDVLLTLELPSQKGFHAGHQSSHLSYQKESSHGSNRRRGIPVKLRPFLLICSTVSQKKTWSDTDKGHSLNKQSLLAVFSQWATLLISPFHSPPFSNLYAAPAFKWLHLDCEEF